MKIAICFIGTGKHLNFFPNYYNTINQYFVPNHEKHFFVFTNGSIDDIPENITVYNVDDVESPYNNGDKMYKSVGGLYRFSTIFEKRKDFEQFDWFVYIDADYYCCAENILYHEFFNEDKLFFGVQHPTFTKEWNKFNGYIPYEKNKNSWAYIKEEEHDGVYLQGCLWGGKIPEVFDLIDELSSHTLEDLSKNVIPKAHDESYLNRYRINKLNDFHVLHPCFAKPGLLPKEEFSFDARMIHSPEYRYKILEVGE